MATLPLILLGVEMDSVRRRLPTLLKDWWNEAVPEYTQTEDTYQDKFVIDPVFEAEVLWSDLQEVTGSNCDPNVWWNGAVPVYTYQDVGHGSVISALVPRETRVREDLVLIQSKRSNCDPKLEKDGRVQSAGTQRFQHWSKILIQSNRSNCDPKLQKDVGVQGAGTQRFQPWLLWSDQQIGETQIQPNNRDLNSQQDWSGGGFNEEIDQRMSAEKSVTQFSSKPSNQQIGETQAQPNSHIDWSGGGVNEEIDQRMSVQESVTLSSSQSSSGTLHTVRTYIPKILDRDVSIPTLFQVMITEAVILHMIRLVVFNHLAWSWWRHPRNDDPQSQHGGKNGSNAELTEQEEIAVSGIKSSSGTEGRPRTCGFQMRNVAVGNDARIHVIEEI